MSTQVRSVSATNGQEESHGIDWTRYSSSYDLMVRYNPFYKENVVLALDTIARLNLPPGAMVCDIGAGTGNYISALSHILDEPRFTHIDADPGMNAVASKKYSDLEIDVSVVSGEIANQPVAQGKFDLILCINALYAMPDPKRVLRWVADSLRPGGHFFVLDYGRKMEVTGWAVELTKSAFSESGVKGVLELYRQAPELIRQNSAGSRMQAGGKYWTHSTSEFLAALEHVGFSTVESGTCYRGVCDYALVQSALK